MGTPTKFQTNIAYIRGKNYRQATAQHTWQLMPENQFSKEIITLDKSVA
jgi:hypothetical protein